jgi:actin-like ATPase involved in cell morphogenesis
VTHVLGIDLGGTAVSAAIADDDGRVEMVALGDRSTTVPSVVHRRDATSLVTGELAARRASGDPDHAVWAVRRRLGDPAPVLLGEEAVPAGDLLAAILRDVLARVTAVRGLVADRVVLTHPASWGPYRRGLFEDVVVAAGLEDAVTTSDPEAAGHQHRAVHGLDDGTALAIYDLGGSAFEATVLTRRGRGVELVGTPVAIERLGGVDFDEAVIALVDEATGGLLADLDPDDDTTVAALGRLRQDCVAAKEALSADDEAMVPVLLPGRHEDVTVTRAAFEERIRSVVARSVEALERAVEAAPVRPSAVLLVGGSSRVPLVQRTVGERLGLPVIVDARPEEIVALGAARAAQAAAPSVTRVTSMVGTELSARSGSGRAAKGKGKAGADSAKSASSAPAPAPAPAAGAASEATAPSQSARPAPQSPSQPAPSQPAPSQPAPSGPAAAASSSGAASSEAPERESDQDPASTALVPSPIVDGRVVTSSDESRTVVARPAPAAPATPSAPAVPPKPPAAPSDEAKTTVTRTTGSDPAKTTVVRPTPSGGTPSTGRPPAAAPPPRRPGGPTPPPRQPGRPAPPSGSFPAQGRPGPGGPGPGRPGPGGPQGPGPRPGWPAGPPGGRPGGPPGGPPPGRPMTAPIPGPGGPGPTPPPAGRSKQSNRTRTVVLVVAGVVVLILLVVALVLTGML